VRGERALRLWDVVTGPYLAGRDWISIDRGEVIEFPAGETASQENTAP
jgi:hypothetical protein